MHHSVFVAPAGCSSKRFFFPASFLPRASFRLRTSQLARGVSRVGSRRQRTRHVEGGLYPPSAENLLKGWRKHVEAFEYLWGSGFGIRSAFCAWTCSGPARKFRID